MRVKSGAVLRATSVFILCTHILAREHGSVVTKVLCYKPEKSRV
jgi:hypothetical protein